MRKLPLILLPLLSIGPFAEASIFERQYFKSEDCRPKQILKRFALVLAKELRNKNFERLKSLFDPEVYFLNDLDSREASFFIEKKTGNSTYMQADFKAFLFDTATLQKKQRSISSLSEVFSEARLNEIREYDNLCEGGQLNIDEKTDLYYDTPAVETIYKGVKYTLYLAEKNGKTIIKAMYFHKARLP